MTRHSSLTIFESHDKASQNQEDEKRKILVLLRKALSAFYTDNKENLETFQSIDEIANAIKPKISRGGLDKLLNSNPVYALKTLQQQILTNEIGFETPEPFATITSWVKDGLLAELTLPKETVEPTIVPDQYFNKIHYKEIISGLTDTTYKIGWRLFVDGTKQLGETAASYDAREPGCLLAMAQSFKYAMTHVDTPLTFEEIIHLHQLCLQGVKELNEDELSAEPYRQSEDIVGFGITDRGREKTKTINGYRELCLHPEIDKDYTVRCDRVQAILYGKPLESRINEILKEYEEKMLTLNTKEEKLHHIVSMVALLERIHPFWDANCRTLCIMVLNKELVRHGFPLTILEDPNRFDSFSNNELMQEVIKGFKTYDYVKKHGHLKGEKPQEKTGKKEDLGLIDSIQAEINSIKSRSKLGY